MEGGPPRFSPRFTGADLLRNICGRSCDFVYGTIALCGAWFHTLRLSHDFVTSARSVTTWTRCPTTPDVQRVAAYTRRVWAISLFARHYSGSRDFFPFLGLLRCFSSPAYRARPYVFRQRHARITTRRFPHSEIPGSKVGQHLPRAYRSRPRPSSALSAKASTVCPYSLDRKELMCCRYGVFKVRAGRCPQRKNRPDIGTVSQNSTA